MPLIDTIYVITTFVYCSISTSGQRSYYKERTQRNTLSLIHSVCMLFNRRSGILLRQSLIVAPLLSLNGVLGISLFSRLSPNWNRLFFIVPTSLDMSKPAHSQCRSKKTPSPGIARLSEFKRAQPAGTTGACHYVLVFSILDFKQ